MGPTFLFICFPGMIGRILRMTSRIPPMWIWWSITSVMWQRRVLHTWLRLLLIWVNVKDSYLDQLNTVTWAPQKAEEFPWPIIIIKAAQSCLILCDPMDYIVHGILQARILEWVAFPFSRGSSQPRDWTQVSCNADGFFTSWATREAHCGSVTMYPTKDTMREKEISVFELRRIWD